MRIGANPEGESGRRPPSDQRERVLRSKSKKRFSRYLQSKNPTHSGRIFTLEVPGGLEPPYSVLQTDT